MKRYIFILNLFCLTLFAVSSDIKQAYSVSIHNDFQNERFLKNTHKTQYDYNNICYITINVIGNLFYSKPQLFVGSSIGSIISEKNIIQNNYIIGTQYVFKFFTIKNGYLKIKIDKKIYEHKIFIK